jgi:hypothetical protein
MGFLNLTLYHHPSGLAFDPEKVLQEARTAFPEARFFPGDQAAQEVQRAEARLADQLRAEGPNGAAAKILASLRRKALSYGPSYAFSIPLADGSAIQGLVRSVGVQFTFEPALPTDLRQKLLHFLSSLGVGYLEEGEAGNRVEILAELPGPCRYVRQAPGIPWQDVPEEA